jgi:hypothetical protein
MYSFFALPRKELTMIRTLQQLSLVPVFLFIIAMTPSIGSAQQQCQQKCTQEGTECVKSTQKCVSYGQTCARTQQTCAAYDTKGRCIRTRESCAQYKKNCTQYQQECQQKRTVCKKMENVCTPKGGKALEQLKTIDRTKKWPD